MANYSLTSFELTDADGFALSQTVEPLNMALGEHKKLTLTLTRLPPITPPTFEYLWLNPALFIPDGDIYEPVGTTPSNRYFADITAGLGSFPTAELPFNLKAPLTQYNERATYEVVSLAEIKIHIYFYVTTDVLDYITASALDNALRLTQTSINNTGAAYNDYQGAIGIYLVSEDSTSGTDYFNFSLQADPVFANQDAAIVANSVQVFRSAVLQPKVSSIEDNDLEFVCDAGIAFSNAKVWIVDLNAIDNTQPFYLDNATIDNGILSLVGGTEYKADYSLLAANVNENGNYLLMAVFYSTVANKSVTISNVFATTQNQDEPAYPDVQSKIEDYLKEYGDYVKAPVYDRLKLSVFLDKSTYNLRSIIGDFDDNFNGWRLDVKQDGITVQSFLSDTATDVFTQTDSPTNFDIEYNLRIEKAWGGSLIEWQWTFYFDNGVQSDTIGFLQKADIHEEQKNITGSLIYNNNGTFTAGDLLDNFCEDLTQIAVVRTTSIADTYAQLAVLVLPEIQEEESYNTGNLLPQLFGDNLQEVDAEWSAGVALAKIDIEGITPDSIAILSKEITEDVQIGATVNLQFIEQT